MNKFNPVVGENTCNSIKATNSQTEAMPEVVTVIISNNQNTLMPVINIPVKIYTFGWPHMMIIVPRPGMMVIVVVIMCLITTG